MTAGCGDADPGQLQGRGEPVVAVLALRRQRRHGLADHGLDELGVGVVRRRDAAEDQGPAPQDRAAVGDRPGLPELVGDDDHGQALRAQGRDPGEQGVDLLGGEHAGRLVEDDDARAAHQDLEDLDPLALPDRQVADLGRGVDREPVALGRLGDLRRELLGLEPDALLVEREGDVLGHRQGGHEPEVLEDHADPEVAGDDGIVDLDLRAVDGDRPLVRGVHAVDDLHQRALARAVLAEHRVHLAGHHVDVDALERDEVPEPAHDASRGQHRQCAHLVPFVGSTFGNLRRQRVALIGGALPCWITALTR